MWLGRRTGAQRLAIAAVLCAGLSQAAPAAELSAEDMKELEGLLAELNFDPGPIDGKFDARTRTAIELYQGFAALPIDGQPRPKLLTELRSLIEVFREVRAAQAQGDTEARNTGTDATQDSREDQAEPMREPDSSPEPKPQETKSPDARMTDTAELPAAQSAPVTAAQPEPTAQAADATVPATAHRPEPKPEPPPAQMKVAKPVQPQPQPQTQAPPRPRSRPEVPKTATTAQTPEAGAEPASPPAVRGAGAAARSGAQSAAGSKAGADGSSAASPPPKAAPGRFNFDTMIARLVQDNGASEKASPGLSSGIDAGGRAGASKGAEIAAAGTRADVPDPAHNIAVLDGYDAFKRGYAAASQGDWDLAIDYYTRAIEAGDLPLDHLAKAFFNRANAHSSRKHLDYAIADYSAAIINKPDFPGAYHNRGFALEEKGDRGRATEDFRKAEALGLRRLGVRSPDMAPPRL